MKIFTIGFTKKNAEEFFTLLKRPELKRLVDVRLNNVSQLAGFAKKDDLRYFLREICRLDYVHLPQLAPDADILDEYKSKKKPAASDWEIYERKYNDLLVHRKVEQTTAPELIDCGCFLCSEAAPERCHRRLAAEYFARNWDNVEIVHL